VRKRRCLRTRGQLSACVLDRCARAVRRKRAAVSTPTPCATHWGVPALISPFNFSPMIRLWLFPVAIVGDGNNPRTQALRAGSHDAMLRRGSWSAARPASRRACSTSSWRQAFGVKRCARTETCGSLFVDPRTVGTLVYNMASQHGKRVQCMYGRQDHAVSCPMRTRITP